MTIALNEGIPRVRVKDCTFRLPSRVIYRAIPWRV